MKPVVSRLEQQYKGKVEFRLINVDTDPQGGALMQQFQTQYVPTFVFINAQGAKIDLKIGGMSEEQMRAALNAL
jgi:thioredoxin-like negative regulator of GroEL